MAVIKNYKTGMWEVRTYYKNLTGARKQKTKRGFAKKTGMWEVRTYYKDLTGERKQKTKRALRRKAKPLNGSGTSS